MGDYRNKDEVTLFIYRHRLREIGPAARGNLDAWAHPTPMNLLRFLLVIYFLSRFASSMQFETYPPHRAF